jgi:molybdopterin-dependent oxidoreductase alpha subunit
MTAERFRRTDPDRSFFYSSGRSSNEAGFVLQLLARLYGTNNINNCSYYCHQATSVALRETIGSGTATVELEDLTRCDLVFIIGANPASNHPRLLHQLKACRDRGGQVVVINPAKEPGLVRFAVPKSPTSMIAGGTEIASAYLQPNIGTDQTLLQAIGKAVLENEGLDRSFVERHTDDFAAYESRLLALGWDEIELRTGVSAEDIRKVADLYCRSEAAVFAWGMGLTHHLHGVENVEEVVNLSLLRGMIGRTAAGLLPLRGHSNVQGIGTIGVKPVLQTDVLARIEELFNIKLPVSAGMDTMAAMQAASQGDIDLALLMGGNLYASNPNSAWAEAALENIDSKIFLTTTINRGHLYGAEGSEAIILPVTARDEEWQPTTQESMFNFVRLSDGGINRLDNVRPETWILSEVGNQVLGKSSIDFSQFQSHRTIRDAIAKIIPGLEELASIDVAKREFHVRQRVLHTPEFNTDSGRAKFRTSTPAPVGTNPARPYTLTTARSEGQFNSIVYEEEDVYRQTANRWCVMMSPDDIKALGLGPQQLVDIRSDTGVMAGVSVVAFDLPPGNCMCYYPEANVLTATGVDPRSRTPSFKSTAVSISCQ